MNKRAITNRSDLPRRCDEKTAMTSSRITVSCYTQQEAGDNRQVTSEMQRPSNKLSTAPKDA